MKKFVRQGIKLWLFSAAVLLSAITNAQTTGFCENFNANPVTPVTGPGCTGTAVPGVLDNWGTINANVGYNDVGSIGGAGDIYLDIDDQGCSNGGSFIYNPVDYDGNWIEMVQGEGCLCFDIRTFYIATGTLTPNTLRIYNTNDPLGATNTATFVMSGSYDVSRGWVRICAPIELSDGTDLPSNADGQWVNTGGAAAWDSLITNVESLAYYVDVGGGDEQFGLDNICISQDCDSTYSGEPEPTNEGAYCCDESDNLIANGNFEFGVTGFSSDYSQNSATLPGQYDVGTSASAFGANVTDHSYCQDATTYANNDQFLLVNGLTNQASGSQSVIWEQTLTGLDPEKEYRFCGNFKNLPQCTFDVLPQITVQLSSFYSETATINTDASDPCDWMNLNFCFRGQEEMVIQIILDEGSLGDGNDLAIDDLSVQELKDPNLNISVLHQGEPQEITGSINTIDPSDDALPYSTEICDQPWFWFVFTVDNYSGGTITIDPAATYGWGNDIGGSSIFNPPSSGPNWDLTTNFPGFPFADDVLYVVGMQTPSCCEDCVDDGFTYQIVLNSSFVGDATLAANDIKFIKDILGTYQTPSIEDKSTSDTKSGFSIIPNPAHNYVTIQISEQELTAVSVYNLNGSQVIMQQMPAGVQNEQLDISSLSAGMYFVHVTTKDGQILTEKLLVK